MEKYAFKELSIISEYQDKNIIGVAFEVDVNDLSDDIEIVNEIVNGKTYQNSGALLTCDQIEKPKENEYLKKKILEYKLNDVVFPQIKEAYWQCSCGRINGINNEMCHCGLTKQIAKKLLILILRKTVSMIF